MKSREEERKRMKEKQELTIPVVVVEKVLGGLIAFVRKHNAGTFGWRCSRSSIELTGLHHRHVADCVVGCSPWSRITIRIGNPAAE